MRKLRCGCAALLSLVAASSCGARQSARLDCRFLPVESAGDELPGCATLEADGRLVLRPEALAAVRNRGAQPVAAVVGSQLYYLNGAGRAVPTLWYDNGADYFAEGLARTTAGGKMGFVDRDLLVRISPAWDFAFPFQGGVARVCQGCRAQPDGEHAEVRGGLWGYIDRDGREVVPVRLFWAVVVISGFSFVSLVFRRVL